MARPNVLLARRPRSLRWQRVCGPSLLLLALGACATGPGATQSRLAGAHATLEAQGFGATGPIAEGSLGEGGIARFPMQLEAQCYTFVAVGGEGARDIDLTVADAGGRRVAADAAHDAQATVPFCVGTRGRYTVAVRMRAGAGSYLWRAYRAGARGSSGAVALGEFGDAGSCQSPIPIQLGQTVTGDTSRGHSRHTGTCNEGGANEVVYQLQLDRRAQITVAAEQDYDGVIYIRRGNCDEQSSEVAGGCNDDDGDTSHSRIVTALDPGTYYIFADGFSDGHGSYTLTVTGADVPSAQEVCAAAAVLSPGQAVSGQTSGDANVFQAACASGARGADRVYRLEVPQESRAQIYQETDYDGVLHVRRACTDAASELACNDDADDTQHSRINTVLAPGTYFVVSDAFGPQASGTFTLEADLAPIAGGGAPGDSCSDALPLSPGTPVEGNTFAARDDVAAPCGAARDGYDVVYRLNVPNRSRVRLWFDHSDLGSNSVLYVTRACGAAPTANAQSATAVGAAGATGTTACRAGAVGDDHALETVLDRGNYYVVVDSAAPRAFGKFRLHARVEDTTALDRLCRAAPVLRNHQTVTGTTQGDDRFQSTCAGNSRSPENLYRLVLRRRSAVRLALAATSQYDPSIYLRANCADASSERECNDDAGDTRHSLIEKTLDAGTYTVFVDGFGNQNAGSYSLEVSINPQ